MKGANHKLRSYYSEADREFIIEGNDDGLRYLADAIAAILRNEPGTPACHWHFSVSNYLLQENSAAFQIARVID